MTAINRCDWVTEDKLYQNYHDHEWGRPVTSPTALFAALCLETQQSGLNWLTVLKKRAAYYQYCYQLDPDLLCHCTQDDVEHWLTKVELIRHRAKLNALIINAQVYQRIKQHYGCFSSFVWQYKPDVVAGDSRDVIEMKTAQAAMRLSKKLKVYGASYIGSTTVKSWIEACGLVNAHQPTCFLYKPI